MSNEPQPPRAIDRILMGAALLSVATFHGYMLYLVASRRARFDGFVPRIVWPDD